MKIEEIKGIHDNLPLKKQRLEKAVQEIKEDEKKVRETDTGNAQEEEGKGGNINVKV